MSSIPDTTTALAGASTFHDRPVDEVLRDLQVDPTTGLDAGEVERRRAEHGPNELDETPRDPAWKRLARQFKDLLILILLAAAVVSFVVSGELKTPIVVLIVVLLNAVIGFVQENRAEASLDALRRMLVLEVRVRRDGAMRSIPAAELVPGDIVAVEAGDRIPADGRLVEEVQLEVEEAALTGESLPVPKQVEPVEGADAAIADRTSMVHMQTTVTRGRGELVVTATGMGTEIGRIAGLLRSSPDEKTPLQRQLDDLAHSLAKLAGVIVALVFAIGLVRGEDVSDLLLTAVALAVASIPEGLPAVTAVTLAIGVSKMAKQQRHREASGQRRDARLHHGDLQRQDRHADPEPDDGRGAHRLGPPGARDRRRLRPGGDHRAARRRARRAVRRCSTPWRCAATPRCATTTTSRRGCWSATPPRARSSCWPPRAASTPRHVAPSGPAVGEVPFDSAHKLMATVHEHDRDGRLWLFAKGAPDALLDRASSVIGPDGEPVPVDELRDELEAHNAPPRRRGHARPRHRPARDRPRASGRVPATPSTSCPT